MSWIQKLYETYDRANVETVMGESGPPMPISHISQQAHIQITLNGSGGFRGAEIVEKEETLVPATEDSAARAGQKPPSHPLCDKIQYVAKDYPAHGGGKSFFEEYRSLLFKWNEAYPNEKLRAILNYVDEGHVVADLVAHGILYEDEKGKLLASWPNSRNKPKIFTWVKNQGELFVRWVVQTSDLESRTWKDKALIDSWVQFSPRLIQKQGLCLITGENTLLGTKHPKGIRYGGDNAKLISANDTAGYTYRGRFTDSEQACSIGYDISQKAHNALKWLIRRQAFRNGEQVIVAWDVSSKFVPSPVQNSHDLLGEDALNDVNSFEDFLEVRGGASEAAGIAQSDYGQLLANRLNKKIMGYRQDLGSTKDIVVMGLDSASPGRMAVTYYRELTGSEFLDRLEAWHNDYAWFQTYPQGLRFVGAPALKEIAEAAFGNQLNDNLCKATINRLLPCVTDGVSLPRDLVRSTHNRAVNRMGMEHWKWEKVLGIACALFRGTKKNADNGGYKMALETERTDRDYLYGRLLAAAECLESVALDVAGEKRDTNAARLMQRFSTRPFSTWLQIEQSLAPYKSRLQNRRPRFFEKITNLLDEIHNLFQAGAYMKKEPLDGAFLLGYHCQRHELRTKAKDKSEQNESDMNASNTHEEELENVSYEEN